MTGTDIQPLVAILIEGKQLPADLAGCEGIHVSRRGTETWDEATQRRLAEVRAEQEPK